LANRFQPDKRAWLTVTIPDILLIILAALDEEEAEAAASFGNINAYEENDVQVLNVVDP
jgi:hypothetical protein